MAVATHPAQVNAREMMDLLWSGKLRAQSIAPVPACAAAASERRGALARAFDECESAMAVSVLKHAASDSSTPGPSGTQHRSSTADAVRQDLWLQCEFSTVVSP
eukprot:SAG22_NODE_3678_length_1581_cov_14.641700_2_plen_104_part_00